LADNGRKVQERIEKDYHIYALRSLKNNKRYIGYTEKDPAIRLVEHNSGTNKWTRQNKPFILVYKEKFNNKTEAIRRERFLKSGQGRKLLDTIIPR
jgi:putative endonuclease